MGSRRVRFGGAGQPLRRGFVLHSPRGTADTGARQTPAFTKLTPPYSWSQALKFWCQPTDRPLPAPYKE